MITVIIATKNGSPYIRRALDSVFNQTIAQSSSPFYDTGFKVRVISDGSTDDTEEILSTYANHEPRLEYIALKKNIGPGNARNLAILGGTTDTGVTVSPISSTYLAFLDDDDIWDTPEKLEYQMQFLSTHTDIAVVGSSMVRFVHEDNTLLKTIRLNTNPDVIKKNILSYNPLITSSVVCRTETFKQVHGFSSLYLAEDYDLWLRIGQISRISNVDNTSITYTVRKNSASHTRKKEMAKTVLHLVQKYKHRYPGYTKAIIKAYLRVLLSYM